MNDGVGVDITFIIPGGADSDDDDSDGGCGDNNASGVLTLSILSWWL